MIEEALHVILDPGHILAEVVLELVSYLTIGRLAIWWHDRNHHHAGNVRTMRVWRIRFGRPSEPLDDEALAKRGLRRVVIQGDTGPRTHVVPVDRPVPSRPNPTPHWMNCEVGRPLCRQCRDENPYRDFL